jgi:hypothetical protein
LSYPLLHIRTGKWVAFQTNLTLMELHVVKGPAEEHLDLENDEDNELGHGCKVMLHLLWYWTSAKCRIVCADSYLPLSKQPVVCLI